MEYLGLLIPLAPFMMVAFIVWSKNQTKLAEMQLKETASASAEQAAQYATQVSKLEDRVQTLERIVTDRGYNVAAQIEALRDERDVEERGSGVPLNVNTAEKA